MTHYHNNGTGAVACERVECAPCSCYDPDSSAPSCLHTCGKADHSTCTGEHGTGPRMQSAIERIRERTGYSK